MQRSGKIVLLAILGLGFLLVVVLNHDLKVGVGLGLLYALVLKFRRPRIVGLATLASFLLIPVLVRLQAVHWLFLDYRLFYYGLILYLMTEVMYA